MKGRYWLQKWFDRILSLLFCFVLLLYTVAFPSNTSWFIFIFVALLFLVLFFSTIFSWEKIEVNLVNKKEDPIDIRMKAKTRMSLPICLPSLRLQLKIKNESFEVKTSVFFQKRIQVLFQEVHLPRGVFTRATICTYGKDYFGIFTHYSEKRIPIDIHIYPHVFSKYKTDHYLKKINSYPPFYQYLSGNSPQFHQIREYQTQDSIKQVDWKTSFRKNRMMVKEFENEITPTLSIVFLGSQSEHFEALLSLAYTLYIQLQNLIPLNILLIGTFEGETLTKDTDSAFLMIESNSETHSIMECYKKNPIQTSYQIIIAPETLRDSLFANSKQHFIYFSEKDLSIPEVNK